MLRSFEIQGFRAFRHLEVPKLGRVNLIVGRNNVGKTMFLEALRLYYSGGNAQAIKNLLLERDEVLIEQAQDEEDLEQKIRTESLFNRELSARSTKRNPPKIILGEIGDASTQLHIQPVLVRLAENESAKSATDAEVAYWADQRSFVKRLFPTLEITDGGVKSLTQFKHIRRREIDIPEEVLNEPTFIPASGITGRKLAKWWDDATIRNNEASVLQCLSLIAPVERVAFVERPYPRSTRFPIIKLRNETLPVPLKSLGDGMSRIFQVALAIERSRINAHPGFDEQTALFRQHQKGTNRKPLLLIDEIENGLHYSVHAKLWEFILRVAADQDIQVVATTHSWDCICGLKEAVARTPNADAMLIRLERTADKDKAVSFSQDELDIITRDEIEVR